MFDRRLLQYFDWGLLGLTILIGGSGLLVLYSAVTAETPAPQMTIFYKQLIWFSTALIAMVVSFSFNYKLLDRWGQIIYIGCIILLVWVLLFGKSAGGSRRWLALGPISVQPSELAKIAIMIALARYYSKDAHTRGFTLRELFRPAILTFIPFILILKQPDLGTAGLLLLIAGSITVFVKIERRSFIYLLMSSAAVIPMVWFFLKDYQKRRILVFLDPDLDPLGAGGIDADDPIDAEGLERQRMGVVRHAMWGMIDPMAVAEEEGEPVPLEHGDLSALRGNETLRGVFEEGAVQETAAADDSELPWHIRRS